jgi:hypothetical protein
MSKNNLTAKPENDKINEKSANERSCKVSFFEELKIEHTQAKKQIHQGKTLMECEEICNFENVIGDQQRKNIQAGILLFLKVMV